MDITADFGCPRFLLQMGQRFRTWRLSAPSFDLAQPSLSTTSKVPNERKDHAYFESDLLPVNDLSSSTEIETVI